MRKLIIAVLIIVALAVAADFGAAAYGEYTISQQIRQQFRLASDPSVRIEGFPFLTQAVGGHYTAIDIEATGLPADSLHDLDVQATLHDVDAPLSEVSAGDLHSVRAAQVDGRIVIKDSDLGRAIGIEDLRIQPPSVQELQERFPAGTPSNSARGDRAPIKMVATTDLAGRPSEITGYGVIELTGGQVRITITDVRLSSDGVGTVSLPREIRQTLLNTLSTDVKPGDLPFNATPTSVWVQTGSVVVEGTARDVSLNQADLGAS
ncbi:MAG: LmeA family phospholipid-binding protein [Pseudonocardiaceae bacterium]